MSPLFGSGQSSVKLVHRGRRSGRVYTVTVWFIEKAGTVWIASLDASRNWVRNVQNSDEVELDFGQGAKSYFVEELLAGPEVEQFRAAISAKYPVASRVMRLLHRNAGDGACFRLTRTESTTDSGLRT